MPAVGELGGAVAVGNGIHEHLVVAGDVRLVGYDGGALKGEPAMDWSSWSEPKIGVSQSAGLRFRSPANGTMLSI